MKKRMGFVSNSSSSSFCLIGVRRKLEDFKDEDFGIKGKHYGGKIFVMTSAEGGEGINATFSITKEDAERLVKLEFETDFYEIIEDLSEDSKTFNSKELADKILQHDKITILSGTMDQNFSVEWLEDNYSEN